MKALPACLTHAVAIACAVLAVDALAQDARSWLDRMNRAVEELSYEGKFVHVHDGQAETLHIVHRNAGGQVGERVLSLDGVGREIIRRGDNVQCILPDRRTVLFEDTRQASPLVAALPSYSAELDESYDLKLYRTARVADRSTQVVGIKPRDEYRYGFVVWLDEETAMPLKSQLRNEKGVVVEQILFTEFQVFDSLPASALEPVTNTEGFTWVRASEAPVAAAAGGDGGRWRAKRPPAGFKLSASTHRQIAGSRFPVEHLVYSDGLATVSVFIEDPKAKADVAEGFSKVGGTNAYSVTLDGRKVTAIGEVPRQTVHRIATSIGVD